MIFIKRSYLRFIIIGLVVFVIVKAMDCFNVDYNLDKIFKTKAINTLENSINRNKMMINKINKDIINSENDLKQIILNRQQILKDTTDIVDQKSVLRTICGKTTVVGIGITISLADNINDPNMYDINKSVVHDIDVRMLINDLNSYGAEAISINGKRVTSSTEIVCSGPVINVNGEIVAAPFFIKAIGDPNKLVKAVTNPSSYAYMMKHEDGIGVKVMKNTSIFIAGKRDDFECRYIDNVEEEN